MDVDNITINLDKHIKNLEKAQEKCKKGILRLEDAKKIVSNTREELDGILPEKSDVYEMYNRFKLDNPLWWNTNVYASKSDCEKIENELIILRKLLSELRSMDSRSSIEEKVQIHIKEGERGKAIMIIYDIMEKSQKSLVVIDPYLDQSLYKSITSLDKNIIFQLLTNEKNLKPIFLETAKQLKDENWHIIVKSTTKFHDRYIIIDNKEVWQLGASIKDAGNKDFTINKIVDDELLEEIIESYKNAWQDSVTLWSGIEFKVTNYRVDLQFPVFIKNNDEATAKSEAKKTVLEWIKKVEKKLGVKFQTHSQDSELIEGSFPTINDLHLELSWKYKGFSRSEYFIAGYVVITAPNMSSLDRLIKAGGHPYWAIYNTLDSKLD
jgi:hypothetical protein